MMSELYANHGHNNARRLQWIQWGSRAGEAVTLSDSGESGGDGRLKRSHLVVEQRVDDD